MRLLLILVTLFSFTAAPFAATAPANGGTKKITIKTSAVCGMCKTNIETALNAVAGVKDAELDVVTKNVKIKYDGSKVDAATLRQAISAAGYDADDVPARKKAYDALNPCCKSKKACEAKADTGGTAEAAGCCAKKETEKAACCAKDAGKACKKDTEG